LNRLLRNPEGCSADPDPGAGFGREARRGVRKPIRLRDDLRWRWAVAHMLACPSSCGTSWPLGWACSLLSAVPTREQGGRSSAPPEAIGPQNDQGGGEYQSPTSPTVPQSGRWTVDERRQDLPNW